MCTCASVIDNLSPVKFSNCHTIRNRKQRKDTLKKDSMESIMTSPRARNESTYLHSRGTAFYH